MTVTASPIEPLSPGLTAIDTGYYRPRFDSAYLIVDDGRAAFVDTGTNRSVPRLLQALDEQGVAPEQVDWVIVTHVHLDHAGGAGLLMRKLPEARLVVHPRGARHMVDPRQLLAGVRAVYGDEFALREYGELVPVPAERVVESREGMVVHVGDRPLRFIDTPGHARHHHCIWDEATRGWFCGDTLGVAYPEFRLAAGHYGLPATTPVQFEPDALHASIERLLAAKPAVAYLTHYSALREVEQQAEMVLRQVDAMVALGLELKSAPDRGPRLREGLLALYLRELRAQGIDRPEQDCAALLDADVELNAQGLEVWLDR